MFFLIQDFYLPIKIKSLNFEFKVIRKALIKVFFEKNSYNKHKKNFDNFYTIFLLREQPLSHFQNIYLG